MDSVVARHLANHNVEEYSDAVNNQFVLSYYDTFALLALLPNGINYVNDTMMRDLNVYKNKVYFTIDYLLTLNSFELSKIIYLAPLSKCMRVITAIKRTLSRDYALGCHIHQRSQNNKSLTIIFFEKF